MVSADNFMVSESNPDAVQYQTATFKDAPSTYTVNMAGPRDSTFDDGYSDNVPLGKFLERPVRINEFQWTTTFENSSVSREIDPWTSWQSDDRVRAKLQNFAYGSFDLKCRFIINGTPFQYGRLLVVYIPYGSREFSYNDFKRTGNLVAGQAITWYAQTNRTSDGVDETTYQHFSTYPHVWLNPSSNQVAEMTLPFIWHNNYISFNGTPQNEPNPFEKETLGSLWFFDVNPLRICNLSTPQRVNVTTYAWAENMKMSIPTDFTPTGNFESCCGSREKEQYTLLEPDWVATSEMEDEYADGPVSRGATAVAAGAGMLKSAPIIGKFARATEIGASAAGNIAKMFGFSAPAMVQNPERFLGRVHGRLANTAGEDSSYSLALDPKQEITVDPTTCGVMPEDEMAISSIVTREQWIARPEWRGLNGQFTSPAGNGQLLFVSLVSPNQFHRTANKGQLVQAMDTPGGHVANMFRFWKGSITYRVEVVCSSMHSGRLKLQFDPYVREAPVTNVPNTEDINTRYTTILDLADETSTEFTIDYNSRFPWLQCAQPVGITGQPQSTSFQPGDQTENTLQILSNFDSRIHMGIFTISIVNELVSPILVDGNASANRAPVQVNVYFKCGEDMQFAQPLERPSNWSLARFTQFNAASPLSAQNFEPTAEMVSCKADEGSSANATSHAVVGASDVDDHNSLVFFGERITSIRSLIKRFSLVYTGNFSGATPINEHQIVTRILPFVPAQVGPNVARRNTFLSYMSPCYLIMRGSTRYKLAYYNRGNGGTTLERSNSSYQWLERLATVSSPTTVGQQPIIATGATNLELDAVLPHGYEGAAFTDNQIQSTLEVQLPFYSNTRYMLGVYFENVENTGQERLIINRSMTQNLGAKHVYSGISAASEVVQQWHAAGDDFSLSFFLGVPPIYEPFVPPPKPFPPLTRTETILEGQPV